MSSQLAIAQQSDPLPVNTVAAGQLAGRGAVDTTSADTPSEFAQLIQSLAPQPEDAKAAPRAGNIPPQPVSRGSARNNADSTTVPAANPGLAPKSANAGPQPIGQGAAQKIGNAAPQPVRQEAVRKTGNTTPLVQTVKNTIAVVSPRGVEKQDATRLGPEGAPACPSQPPTAQPAASNFMPDVSGGDAVLGTKRDVSTQNSADVSGAGETNTPLPPPKQESTEAGAPVETQPMRKAAAPAKNNESPLPPAIAIATPVLPLPLPLPPVATRIPESNAPAQSVEVMPQESSPPVLTVAPALEVRIRGTEQSKEVPAGSQNATPVTQAQAPAQLQPQAGIPVLSKTVSSPISSQAPPQPQVQPQSNSVVAVAQPQAAPVPAPAASRMERPVNQPAQYYEEAAEAPGRSQTQVQPLRSVSLEFTPDGAADVRLRLSERAGDVHIELHSTDPTLTGHLSESVHDLASSLVNAGYDAQAWTPGQDRESGRGQQQEDPSGARRGPDGDPDAEDFETTMQEPMKEYS